MRDIRHALTGALYGLDEDGLVRVELDGRTGWFDAQGRWVRGELREAVPHLCLWIAGPQLPADATESRRAVLAQARGKSALGGEASFA